MKIEVLGVGAGLCPELGNVSFLIWDECEESAVLMDCGFTVYRDLVDLEHKSGRSIIDKIGTIFISHMHSDHVGSLETLLSDRCFIKRKRTRLCGVNLYDYLAHICGLEYNLAIDSCSVHGIELIETKHIPQIRSVGCLWQNKLFYSGDTGYSLLQTNLAEQADLIIHEVSLTSQEFVSQREPIDWFVHVGIDDLALNSTPEARAKTWLVHYTSDQVAVLEQKAKEYGFAGLLKTGQILEF